MNRKIWQLADYDKRFAIELAEECSIDAFTALLLSSRGVDTAEKVEAFLSQGVALSDPFLLKDMDKAVQRIQRALDSFERICIYGDYDADGVTATAILYNYLEAQGADVIYYIPSRSDEGYGLHKQAIDKLSDRGVRLIITVDNGISAVDEAAYIAECGMELVITDHHRPIGQLPQAVAVVDPHREDDTSEYKAYAGVGVAFKLLCALEQGMDEDLLDMYADLVAIGTVADIVPLVGENRSFVSRGLELMNFEPRPGVDALKRTCNIKDGELDSGKIAFVIAPRINAAGRVESADLALKLLLSEDEGDAELAAEILNKCNEKRHSAEKQIMNDILDIIKAKPELLDDRILVFDGEGWNSGVIGIVASKVMEHFGKPSIVICRDDDTAHGSCRSMEGFSIFDALSSVSDILTHFGGHHLAAGFGLRCDMIEQFRKRINQYAREFPLAVQRLTIDCKVKPANMGIGILSSLRALEPFGAGNPVPVFGLYNMRLKAIKAVGQGKHLRLLLERDGTVLPAMRFGVSEDKFPFKINDVVDVAVLAERNDYMGRENISLHIKDIRPAGADEEALLDSRVTYDKLCADSFIASELIDAACPERGLISEVFRFIRAAGLWSFSTEMLAYRMKKSYSELCKLKVSLDALSEVGVLTYSDGTYRVNPQSGKVSLADSQILMKLGYSEI